MVSVIRPVTTVVRHDFQGPHNELGPVHCLKIRHVVGLKETGI